MLTRLGTLLAETAATHPQVLLEQTARSDAQPARVLEGFRNVASRLTVVVNAAGVYAPATLADYDDASYHQIFDVNVLGALVLACGCNRGVGPG